MKSKVSFASTDDFRNHNPYCDNCITESKLYILEVIQCLEVRKNEVFRMQANEK